MDAARLHCILKRSNGTDMMRSIATSLFVIGVAFAARADDPAAGDAKAAIKRGAAFLAKDALQWKKDHNCVSCHHSALVSWALREAKLRGHSVDEPVLSEMTKWVAESGSGKTGVPRPDGIPKALNVKAVLFALALNADPQPDEVSQKGLGLLLQTVKEDQNDDGVWNSWPDTRPPIFGHSDETATAYATLALLPQAAAGDESAIAARDKGLKWLAEHETTGDHQAVCVRLILSKSAGRPNEESQPLVKRLLESQREDGGWGQIPDMASDGHATGQALYALSLAGAKPNDPVLVRGRQFLIKTQREDGGWTMTSRPCPPSNMGAKNLIPITGAGSSWAVLGLVRSTE
jgi:hypothetical protein